MKITDLGYEGTCDQSNSFRFCASYAENDCRGTFKHLNAIFEVTKLKNYI